MTQDTFSLGQAGPAPIPDATSARLSFELLGGPARYNLAELAERSGLSTRLVTDFWRWIGLPIADPEAAIFTDFDVASLHGLAQLIATEHLSHDSVRALARSIGHLTERMVAWQGEAFVEHIASQHKLDDISARRVMVDSYPHLAGLLSRQADHSYRRHMVKLMERYTHDFGEASDSPPDSLPFKRAVGFADIVGFTSRTAGLSPDELVAYIDAFESRARDIVTDSGGWVVKTVGDAVLFMAEDLSDGVEIALGLSEQSRFTDVIPVRVGFVWGRILSRFGDAFGPAVNLASRLTDLAEPGGILTDPGTASLIDLRGKYQLDEVDEAQIKGLDTMRPVKLERRDGTAQ